LNLIVNNHFKVVKNRKLYIPVVLMFPLMEQLEYVINNEARKSMLRDIKEALKVSVGAGLASFPVGSILYSSDQETAGIITFLGLAAVSKAAADYAYRTVRDYNLNS
jgi:hypothetical protein